MNYFIDIDGTLTNHPSIQWSPVIPHRIETVRYLIARGESVVLWTGGGKKYAEDFAKANGLDCLCLAKPDIVIDDNPTLRPRFKKSIVAPPEVLDR